MSVFIGQSEVVGQSVFGVTNLIKSASSLKIEQAIGEFLKVHDNEISVLFSACTFGTDICRYELARIEIAL